MDLRLCLAFLAFFRARVSRRDGQDPHRVLLRCSPRGQQERLPQLRGRTSWLERPARVSSHVARAFRDDRTTNDRPRKNPLGSRAPNRARFTTERADPPCPITSSQIDLRPHDSKNTLKRKVSAKTGVPFERLRMRLGPFNEVHLFDKNGPVTPRANGVSVAMRDSLLPRAPELSNFGAKDHELPQDTLVNKGEHPYARWHQTWEDVEPHLVK